MPRFILRSALLLVLTRAGSDALGADWLRSNLFSRITLTGNRTIGFHLHTVDGDRDTFNSLNYYGQGNKRFTDSGSVDFEGTKVFGLFNFRGTISDSRINDPQQQHFSLDYAKGAWKANAGDIWGSMLTANPYASLSRSMRGASIELRQGNYRFKILKSIAKGSARTISFQGNNSSGPYYLQSNQIVAGSEQIQLDGRDLVLGTDYVINYEVGYITLINAIVPPTSTIVATYEALGFNSSQGDLQGAAAAVSFGKAGQLGLTALQQNSRSAGGLSTRLEKFEGFGAPATPYFLQFEPLRSRPILIKVDGIPQVEHVDYVFDTTNPSVFYFTRFMPAERNIDVVYTPKPTQTVDGDRRVFGLDYRLPISRYGSVTYSQATGELSNGVNPLRGTARGISSNLKFKNFTLRTNFSDIPESFVSVESRGFQRNEKASRLFLDYEKGVFGYGASYENSRVASRLVDNSGNISFNPSRRSNTALYIRSGNPDGWSWSAEQSFARSHTLTNDIELNKTSLNTRRSFGRFKFGAGTDYETGSGKIDTTNGLQPSKISLNAVKFDADYSTGNGWSFLTRNAFSTIHTSQGTGNGRDTSLSAVYRNGERFSLEAALIDSNSGQLASLGSFDTGSGLGFDGNGFSGGAGGANLTFGATNQRVQSLRTQYKLSPKVSLDSGLFFSKSSGSVTSNTNSRTINLGVDLDLGNRQIFTTSIGQNDTRFIGSSNRSSSFQLDMNLSGNPKGPWSYSTGLDLLLSGGNSSFAQNSYYFDSSLTNRFASRQAASLSFSAGRTTGYYPQNEFQISLTHQYQLYDSVAIATSLRWRKVANIDASVINGAYRARSLDIELIFNFGR